MPTFPSYCRTLIEKEKYEKVFTTHSIHNPITPRK